MSGICTRHRQYSLCASPTKERKGRRQKSSKVNESETIPHLINHTLKVPVTIRPTSTTVGKKKPPRNTTLKRKKEIRDALWANTEDYSDNFFDSTPVRTRKLIKYPITDILVTDPEADDEHDTNLNQHILFNGSCSTSPFNDHCLFASPPTLSASVERKNADIIILRMQKSKRCRKYTIRAMTKADSSSVVTRSTKVINTNVFDNTRKADYGNLSSEDDTYFSNAEDEEAGSIYI